jgi:hypothetical protein
MSKPAELDANPFFVLELAPDCSRIEIEREGQKLLAMLQIGLDGAAEYSTPFGRRPRTPELVRESMAALRDPRRRLIAEMWARAPSDGGAGGEPGGDPDRGWAEAMSAFGFGGSRR